MTEELRKKRETLRLQTFTATRFNAGSPEALKPPMRLVGYTMGLSVNEKFPGLNFNKNQTQNQNLKVCEHYIGHVVVAGWSSTTVRVVGLFPGFYESIYSISLS